MLKNLISVYYIIYYKNEFVCHLKLENGWTDLAKYDLEILCHCKLFLPVQY